MASAFKSTYIVFAGQTLHLYKVVALEDQLLALDQNLVGSANVHGGTSLGEFSPVTLGHLAEHVGHIIDIGGTIGLRLETFLLQEVLGHVGRRNGMSVQRSLLLTVGLKLNLGLKEC